MISSGPRELGEVLKDPGVLSVLATAYTDKPRSRRSSRSSPERAPRKAKSRSPSPNDGDLRESKAKKSRSPSPNDGDRQERKAKNRSPSPNDGERERKGNNKVQPIDTSVPQMPALRTQRRNLVTN